MALNAEKVLNNAVVTSEPSSDSPPLVTARGAPLTSTPSKQNSPAKLASAANAREAKAQKRREEEQKRLALQEELSNVKQLLERKRKADEIASSASSEESSSEESSEEEEQAEPVLKKRKLNVAPPRATPTIEFESAGSGSTRSVWAKIGGLFVICAANAIVSALGGFNRPAVPPGQKQPAINAFSSMFA